MPSTPTLHSAALEGSLEAFRSVLDSGKDVNALEDDRTTALMCAIAGPNWQDLNVSNDSSMTSSRLAIIRHILEHPKVTLFTLNAPQAQFRGVTPLGMASWLNMPGVVQLLLSAKPGSVSVDSMDAHGATALMYAARDGNLEVVQTLISYGARPDFRDKNHRSTVQFALRHPQVLFMCEDALRAHRYLESESSKYSKLLTSPARLSEFGDTYCFAQEPCTTPPPQSAFDKEALSKATEVFIHCIASGDSSLLRSILFFPRPDANANSKVLSPALVYPLSCPLLVNRPDSDGWSPIHYCVTAPVPSTEVLDALYCVGADVVLFTTHEHYTPLHCLARFGRPSDASQESVHRYYEFVAHLVNDLRAPLASRAKHDETCLHVAAEHGESVEVLMILLELDTSGTVREMRNRRGLTALEVAKPEFRTAFGKHTERLRCLSSLSQHTIRASPSYASFFSTAASHDFAGEMMTPDEADISEASMRLLSNLRWTSPGIPHDSSKEHLTYLDMLVEEATQLADLVIRHFQKRSREVATVLGYVGTSADTVSALSDRISLLVDEELRARGLASLGRGVKRDSDDSEVSAISQSSMDSSEFGLTQNSIATSSQVLLEDGEFSLTASSTNSKRRAASFGNWLGQTTSPSKSGKTFRLVEWFKKTSIFAPDKPSKGASHVKPHPLVLACPDSLDRNSTLKQRDVFAKRHLMDSTPSTRSTSPSDRILQSSHLVLDAVNADIRVISERLESAQCLLDRSDHWIARAERILRRALEARRQMIERKRRSSIDLYSDDLFLKPSSISSSPNDSIPSSLNPRPRANSSKASIISAASAISVVSVSEPMVENDDEEARAVRRLILRKIDAGIDGALEDVAVLDIWLRILKESVRSVRRRSFL